MRWKNKIADDPDVLHNLNEMEHSGIAMEDVSQQNKSIRKNGQRVERVQETSAKAGKEMV